MKPLASFLLATMALTSSMVQGYYNSATLMRTVPFQGGMAQGILNNSMILFGGENSTDYGTSSLYRLTQTSNGYTWTTLPQSGNVQPVKYAQGFVTASGNQFLAIGGLGNFTQNTASSGNTTANATAPAPTANMTLLWQTYDIQKQTWTTSATNPSFPENRYYFSLAYDSAKNNVYIFGGFSSNTHEPLNDLWVISGATGTATKLPSPACAMYGHTASLANGKMVILGGVSFCNNGANVDLNSMDKINLFDTASNQWSTQQIGGNIPSTRAYHNAVSDSKGNIIILGGSNAQPGRFRQYTRSMATLDTTAWTWSFPQTQGIPPSFRAFANAAMLDNTHVTFAMGEALGTYYNDINVLDTSDYTWLQSFDGTTGSGNSTSGLSTGVIVGVAIACVALLVIALFCLWKFGRYIKFLVTRIHHDIWRPRSGEPIWAETTRIGFQVFFLFIFTMFLVFVIRQAIDSPNVVQQIEYAAAQVDTPDVRFCFEGYPMDLANPYNENNPGVACQTDIGYSCNAFMMQLNMSVFTPTFTSNLGNVQCFLYRAPNWFQLTGTSGQNNGSRLIFTMYGDQSLTSGRVHVATYPKAMDPNQVVYGIQDDTATLLSTDNVLSWQNNERNDVQTTNVFEIQPFTFSAMSYQLVDHRYLQPDGWNYVGFLPIANSTPEVNTNFRQEYPSPTYTVTHPDIGLLAVSVDKFVVNVAREVKMYTLLNALGFVGGIFGLLIAVQTWLFGMRPRSPWGVIHRWSMGDMKRSLLRGLHDNFKTTETSGIPLVHPVHKRFSMTNYANLGAESEQQRISRVEERMQVMELLFKAYYVDDEVFRSLDNANKTAPPGYEYGNHGPMFPSNEKVDLQHGSAITTSRGSPAGGRFSHMFNHRNSINSENSQQQLTEDPHNNVRLNNM
ncbi:hypothetical protein BC940DRAFT_314410 [Gongronella butleri]|nr:hypothetical protein BC940DRAFT_314410 [Gongronella butleri]